MKRASMFIMIIIAAAVSIHASELNGTVRSTAFFEYDNSQPLNPDVQFLEKNARYTKYHVFYGSTMGERVPAYLFIPAKGKEPFPCVIIMHGSGGSKEDFGVFYDYLSMRGYAVLAVDAAFHGERKNDAIRAEKADWYQTRNMIIQTVVDLRRGVDWLETRAEIDPNRIGYLGASQGTFIGSIFSAVETRVKAAVLLVGGADFSVFFRHSQIPSIVLMRNYFTPEQLDKIANDLAVIDPQYYIGAISPRPVLLINGKKDLVISEEAGKRLHELAGEPKETYWYDGGHLPDFDKVLVLTPKFLNKYLKNLKPPEKTAVPPVPDKPVIKADIARDVSDPQHRIYTVTATTEKPLPQGASLALNFSETGPNNFPLFDDGTHGDNKAGDGIWTMKFEFGPTPVDIAIIGGYELYSVSARAVDSDGAVLSSIDLGTITGDKIELKTEK